MSHESYYHPTSPNPAYPPLDPSPRGGIKDRLLRLAGIVDGDKKVDISRDLAEVFEAAILIHEFKGAQYGDYVESRKSIESRVLRVAIFYGEMRRKWVRLENIISMMCEDPDWDERMYDLALETLVDLGVYAFMNIELLTNIESK